MRDRIRRLIDTSVTRGLVGWSVASLRLLSCGSAVMKGSVARMCCRVKRVIGMPNRCWSGWPLRDDVGIQKVTAHSPWPSTNGILRYQVRSGTSRLAPRGTFSTSHRPRGIRGTASRSRQTCSGITANDLRVPDELGTFFFGKAQKL